MSDAFDPEMVQATYREMSDEELTRFATNDADGLTPQAKELLISEIKRRNVDTRLVRAVEAQNRQLSPEEIDRFCEIIRRQTCPQCGERGALLNATLTGTVMSFLVTTTYRKKVYVACPDCLDKASNKALLITCILGWWGIPWGFIYTPAAIALNLKHKARHHSGEHSAVLRGFVVARIGRLERIYDQPDSLGRMLWQVNKKGDWETAG